jgi:hypothetical protein
MAQDIDTTMDQVRSRLYPISLLDNGDGTYSPVIIRDGVLRKPAVFSSYDEQELIFVDQPASEKASLYTCLWKRFGVVIHGDDANAARPDCPWKLLWIGSVEPVNMRESDDLGDDTWDTEVILTSWGRTVIQFPP